MNLKNISKLLSIAVLGIALNAFAAPTTDGEILDVVKTANDAEISAAEVAATRATSPKVREFASHMLKEHKTNNSDATKVSEKSAVSFTSSVDSSTLKSNADAKMAELQKAPANSRAFDEAYMNQQVSMHKALLDDLNNTLIPTAKNADVKKYLQDTKKHVESHLAQANKVLKEM